MSEKTVVLCVVGPTASGKTALGVELAKRLDGEIVSADSMQIYKNMPIASAVPSDREKCGIPHHLIEFVDPTADFTVADYVTVAREKISLISERKKLPIIVGGTGLYINSLVDNIEFIEQETDYELRESLSAEFDRVGGEIMLERLRKIDTDTALKLHANDKKRIIRAFEIFETSGKTVTEQNKQSRENGTPYFPVMIGITYRDREKLYERINKRVDKMLENGILDEARTSFESITAGGALQAIGHKEFYPYLSGEISLDEAVESLKRSTRRYAKRQLTWFRRDDRIHWIYADECDDVVSQAVKIYKEMIQ